MRNIILVLVSAFVLAVPSTSLAQPLPRKDAPTLTQQRKHKARTFSQDMHIRKQTMHLRTQVRNRMQANYYPVEGGEATVNEVNQVLYVLGFPGVMGPGYYWYLWTWFQASVYNWGYDPSFCWCLEESTRISVFMASGDREGVRQNMLYPSDDDPKWRRMAIACALAAAGPYSVAVFNNNDPWLTREDDLQAVATSCALAMVGAYVA